jgi:hypothetical protein
MVADGLETSDQDRARFGDGLKVLRSLSGEILVLSPNAQHAAKLFRNTPRCLYARLHHVFGAVGCFAHTRTGGLALLVVVPWHFCLLKMSMIGDVASPPSNSVNSSEKPTGRMDCSCLFHAPADNRPTCDRKTGLRVAIAIWAPFVTKKRKRPKAL